MKYKSGKIIDTMEFLDDAIYWKDEHNEIDNSLDSLLKWAKAIDEMLSQKFDKEIETKKKYGKR